ncbi:AMP-binding protein [Shimia thalassica]|uniref:acyl-CoA synthetase n=1 Tax=Shimia thalassica TaxID=1715693 RepID=UPI00273500F3|nr:AMP-binding protein [Shimia thalassica]MDP2580326.1 AMP-binding protein [Shimia thalassica]
MKRTEMTTYEEAYNGFQWEIPDTFNYGGDVVDRWAENPDRMALIWVNDAGEERRFTYADIRDLTNRFANYLTEKGVEKGDRVLIMLPRLPEWQIAMVGCNKIGAVPIPCVTMSTEKDITYRLQHSGAKAAVTIASEVSKVSDDVPVRICLGDTPGWDNFDAEMQRQSIDFSPVTVVAEDPAIMFYTSGSTGLPKGVLHASRALFSWRVSAWHWLSLHEDDVMWCTADTGWSKAGTSILYGPWSCGCTVLFYDGPFDANKRLDLLETYKVSVYCAAATEIRQLVQLDTSQHDLSDLRLSVSAGESVNPEIVRAWSQKTGALLLDGYGQTETLMTVLNYRQMPVKPGSMGKPLPGTEATILAENGTHAETGTPGQLAIRYPHPQIMLGYWDNPEKTKENFLDVDGVTWFLTGDSATMDAEGYLFFDGRDDDLINSSGYRIGPMEVENALMEHDAVLECAVAASPDETRGEVVKAFVILKPGVTGSDALAKDLQQHTKALTAPYKYPRKIDFVDELPKTSTGKIQRRILKQQEFANVN